MIRPPSLQSDYTLCFSEDVALDLPALDGLEGEALDKAIEERVRLLADACNRGAWGAITKHGQQPSHFQVRPIYADITWLLSERERRKLSTAELYELAFRLAIKSIDNFGNWKPVFDQPVDESPRLLSLASLGEVKCVGLGSPDPHMGTRIVHEIGRVAFEHAMDGVRPL